MIAAIPHFERALQLNPDGADAHSNLVVAFTHQGKWNEAIQHFKRALQLKPNSAEAHNNLAFALVKQGKWNTAIQHYQQALQLKPDYAEAGCNLAWLLATCRESQIRNPAEALRRAQRARELTQSAGDAGGGSGGQRGFRPGGCDRNPSAGIGQSSRQSYFGAADSKPAALELSRPALLRTATGRGVETAVTQVKWVN